MSQTIRAPRPDIIYQGMSQNLESPWFHTCVVRRTTVDCSRERRPRGGRGEGRGRLWGAAGRRGGGRRRCGQPYFLGFLLSSTIECTQLPISWKGASSLEPNQSGRFFWKETFLGCDSNVGVVRCAQVEAENNECPVCCRGGSPRETEMILSAARAPLPSTKPQDHFLGATHRNVVNQKVSLALITRLVSMKWTLLNVVLHVLLQMFWVASADLLVLHNLGSFLLHFSYDYFVYLSFYSLSQLFLLFSLFRLFAHLSRPWSIGWVAITFFVCFSLPSLSRYGDKQLDLRFFQYIQA